MEPGFTPRSYSSERVGMGCGWWTHCYPRGKPGGWDGENLADLGRLGSKPPGSRAVVTKKSSKCRWVGAPPPSPSPAALLTQKPTRTWPWRGRRLLPLDMDSAKTKLWEGEGLGLIIHRQHVARRTKGRKTGWTEDEHKTESVHWDAVPTYLL